MQERAGKRAFWKMCNIRKTCFPDLSEKQFNVPVFSMEALECIHSGRN